MTRLHDSKGNSYLVDAAKLVLERRPEARFVVIGEGPLGGELEAQARRLGLGDRFRFGGFAKDVARVVSAFDVSVFPSLWEGTPLTVVTVVQRIWHVWRLSQVVAITDSKEN